MKSKTVKIFSASALILAAALTASAFSLGGLVSSATESTGTSSEIEKEMDAFVGKYAAACSNFMTARAKAEKACKNDAAAATYEASAKSILEETDVKKISAATRESMKISPKEMYKNADLTDENVMTNVQDSISAFSEGSSQQLALAKEVSGIASNASAAMKSAGTLEKAKLIAKYQPFIDLSKVLPEDAKTSAETLDSYVDFAKENNIAVAAK